MNKNTYTERNGMARVPSRATLPDWATWRPSPPAAEALEATPEAPAEPAPEPLPEAPAPPPPSDEALELPPAPPPSPSPSAFRCDRCRHREYRDVPIHEGQSTRRDCARCGRFAAFVVWYGRWLVPPPTPIVAPF